MVEPAAAAAGEASASGITSPARATGVTAHIRVLPAIFMLCASHAQVRAPDSALDVSETERDDRCTICYRLRWGGPRRAAKNPPWTEQPRPGNTKKPPPVCVSAGGGGYPVWRR